MKFLNSLFDKLEISKSNSRPFLHGFDLQNNTGNENSDVVPDLPINKLASTVSVALKTKGGGRLICICRDVISRVQTGLDKDNEICEVKIHLKT